MAGWAGIRVAVLGPVRVYGADGTPIVVGGARLRTLLARLALATGEVVSAESLVDDLWGAALPADAGNALHALVYRLRRVLGGTGTLESAAAGYRLAVPGKAVDAHRFEELAASGRRELAAGSPERAARVLAEALSLWQGPALADVLDVPFARPARTRLDELRGAAVEDRFEAELLLGHHAEVVADLEAASAANPLRERLAALRMRALHAAGRQSEALAVYDRVRATLAEELGVDPAGEVRDAHLSVLRGGADRAGPAPGRLPAPLTSFVGRDEELVLLAGLLETSRLVTVVGPGGAGKTRLAVEAAARHRAHRRGRVWLVPLAGVTAPDGVPDAVLGVLSSSGARPAGGGPAESLDKVSELLGGGEAVLVVDNCEHLVDAVAEFARELLERRPRLVILATSREPLQVTGEALARLGPLELPPPGTDPAESAAVRLFLDRATAVRPGFALDAATTGPVVEICAQLDGLPLALELGAARLRSLDAGQIAQRLGDRFRLLSTGNRGAGPRQRTLSAVIEWSWELLTEPERTLARRVSVFPAPTGADAVEAVCAAGTLPAAEVLPVLDSLVDKSIVEHAGGGYRMLETIRVYADGELGRAGEREAVRRAYTRHFAALAEEHELPLRSGRQEDALAVFEAEYDNLVFALRSAVADGDAGAAARLLGPLYWYWTTLRFDARAETFVAGVLELGDALPRTALAAFTAIDLLAGGAEPVTGDERMRAAIEDCVRTHALERYPLLLLVVLPMGAMLGLEELVDREIRRVLAGSDRWAHGCAHLVAVYLAHERGAWAELARACTAALRAFECAGDRLWTAMALAGVARVHSVHGDLDAAIAAHERALALIPRDEVGYRLALAAERMRGGDLAGAQRDIEATGRTASHSGSRLLEVEVLVAQAELHRLAGAPERSEQMLGRLAEVAEEAAMPATAIEDRITPARVANLLSSGDAVRARELLPRAVRAAFTLRDPASAAQLLAKLLFLEGDATGAATALGLSQVIRGAFDHGDPELRELVTALTGRLGEAQYARAFGEGATTPRQDALDRIAR